MVWHVFNYVNMVWCERISGEEVLAGCESCRDTHHLPPAQLIVKFNCSGQVLTRRGNIYNTIRRIQILCIKMSRFGPESVNDTKLKKKKKGDCVVVFLCFVADHYSPSSPRDLTTHSVSFNSGLKVAAALDGGWLLTHLHHPPHDLNPDPLKEITRFFCFFFNVENCMTVGKIGFVPDPPLHHSSYFPHLYLALSSIPGTLLPSVPPRFLAVALLAVSPICFHSLGQDSLLCSSDTFSHRAAQCN